MPSLTNSVRPAIRTATAAPPGSFGHVANSRAMIFSTLLSATGEPAGAEEAIRAVINAADASRIIQSVLKVLVSLPVNACAKISRKADFLGAQRASRERCPAANETGQWRKLLSRKPEPHDALASLH